MLSNAVAQCRNKEVKLLRTKEESNVTQLLLCCDIRLCRARDAPRNPCQSMTVRLVKAATEQKSWICRNEEDCGFDMVTIYGEDPTGTVPTPSFPGSRYRIVRSMVVLRQKGSDGKPCSIRALANKMNRLK